MIERRYFKNVDVRMVAESDKPPMLVGIAAPFNAFSEVMTTRNGAKFRETIAPGAFSEAIVADDVRCLLNHDPNYVLGRKASGTLRMQESVDGLQIEADMPETTYARDLRVSMDRGDINQMSFGFITKPGGDKWDMVDGMAVRTLLSVELCDVSVVTYPAYADTTVAVRSMDEWKKSDTSAPADKKEGEAEAPASLEILKKKLNLKERDWRLKK